MGPAAHLARRMERQSSRPARSIPEISTPPRRARAALQPLSEHEPVRAYCACELCRESQFPGQDVALTIHRRLYFRAMPHIW